MTELSFGQILQLVRRWWWILVLLPVVAVGAAWFVTKQQTPIYQAQSTLLIDRNELTNGATSYDSLLAAERLSRTFGALITTRGILDDTIARMGLPLSADELKGMVSVKPVSETQLMRIVVDNPDPVLAAEIANTIAAVFTEQIDADRAATVGTSSAELQPAIDELEGQIADTSATIAELEADPNVASQAVQSELQVYRSVLTGYQQTHADLLESRQRMTLLESETGIRVRVVDPAVPSSSAISPKPVQNMAIAFMGALALAAGLVLLLGYLDDTVKSPEDVQRVTGKLSIGLIPKISSSNWEEALRDPRSATAEAYRGLRTNLQFATVGQNVRTMLITSGRPGEGKSTTALQLGLVLAQTGQRVVLVDADLRRPQLHRLAGLSNTAGLTNLLIGEPGSETKPLLQWSDVPSLEILPTGPLPPNPADILNLPRMADIIAHLESMADVVLIDTPPMAFSDALIISQYVDGCLIVAEAGKTRTKELAQAVQAFEQTNKPVLGTILNKVDFGRGDYRRYEYYRAYYEREDDTPRIDAGQMPQPVARRRIGWLPHRRAS